MFIQDLQDLRISEAFDIEFMPIKGISTLLKTRVPIVVYTNPKHLFSTVSNGEDKTELCLMMHDLAARQPCKEFQTNNVSHPLSSNDAENAFNKQKINEALQRLMEKGICSIFVVRYIVRLTAQLFSQIMRPGV